MLRPSISRAEHGTLEEWIECAEVMTLKLHGTPSEGQQLWIDTFFMVPPSRYDVSVYPDLMFESREYDEASHGAEFGFNFCPCDGCDESAVGRSRCRECDVEVNDATGWCARCFVANKT